MIWLLLTGHQDQKIDEEEEGEVDEDEEEVLKKSSEGKDNDVEVVQAEKKEAVGQVCFAPITRTVFWIRELNTNLSVLDG